MMYCLLFVGIGAISLVAMFLQVTFFLTQSKNFESKFYFDKEFRILPILKEDSMIHLTVPIAHES